MDYRQEYLNLVHALDREIHEAVVFHGSRVLEVLLREISTEVLGHPSGNLYAAIEGLRSSGVLGASNAIAMHGLRRLGNDARHATRMVSSLEAVLAVRWLIATVEYLGQRWCNLAGARSALGEIELVCPAIENRFDAFLRMGISLTPNSLDQTVRTLDAMAGHPAAELAVLEHSMGTLPPDVLHSLVMARCTTYPEILRFRQLAAVLQSRRGCLDDAEASIRACVSEDGEDPESLGILGGILKRRYLDTGNRESLNAALACYRRGWTLSRASNSYLGINVAGTLLWRGDRMESSAVAGQVLALLESASPHCDAAERHWNELTRFEALTLLGNLDEASRLRARLGESDDCPENQLRIADAQVSEHRRRLWPWLEAQGAST